MTKVPKRCNTKLFHGKEAKQRKSSTFEENDTTPGEEEAKDQTEAR
jgi:hypothetical protein